MTVNFWTEGKGGVGYAHGPADLTPLGRGTTLLVKGDGPDGTEWIVALGYAVARGCSVIRK